ncbi:hypothetical protein HUJ04_004875 [Dendroctonus ponderosae]|uniref:GPI ethanolamine phosphate transferase 1 n=1 Tax=Dendroctonus ponderosae TaxID=77166 RepID=A0AAR5NX23_DENPD|nr:hypothetical protein HUJ04_004875 [Dendroctonus ponderosae]
MGHDEDRNTNKSKKYQIVILGLAVHALLLFAVFDIYFSSPLDQGMRFIRSTRNPPAKRIVIFVADGLRAEAVLDKNMERIPFLKTVLESKGSWGVAHTRVPTESRPGHVALLAGIYEDPSAILKGWKANPVNFDSVINQSSSAWCWGSPDILNVFKHDNLSHIHMSSYSADLEDFGEKDSRALDLWVFNEVEKFLEWKSKMCENQTSECDFFDAGGNVFFLHLLGIDTAGHGFKPHSKEYVENIQFVDEKVKTISQLFTTAFNDDKTAFVFTADHGMTDWGSHGTGSAHETETIFVAWGAGINRSSKKRDVKQIDIAPFLASLIGINIPSNSLGEIPLDYLDLPIQSLAEIQFSNMLQLLELFNIKRLRTEANALVFLPYKGLTSEVIEEKLAFLAGLLKSEKFQVLIDECRQFLDVLLPGLDYYHNYYQYPLLVSVSLGFIGWILFLGTCVLDKQSLKRNLQTNRSVATLLNMVPIALCYAQKYPLSYYIYFSFPFVVFSLLLDLRKVLHIFKQLKTTNFFTLSVYVIGIELMIYGFFKRSSFSVLAILIGFWILSFGKFASRRDKVLWLGLCGLLAIFPLLPVMKTSFSIPMYFLGSASWVLLFYEMYFRLKVQHQFRNINIRYGIFFLQLLCVVVASIYSISLEYELVGLNSPLKHVSWVLSILPISLIPFTSTFIGVRLIATFFGFAPFYLLVSTNFEAFFLAIHVAILCNWLLIESKFFNANDSENLIYYVSFAEYRSKERVTSDMFRRAFLFMVFIFLGFFGTGNIASLNSFDPMWVRTFLTVFSPFKMMGLIIMKIIVPFLFTCCVFRAINAIGKENILQMFCIILVFSDLMVLQFLYFITNVGSWMDIGSSLSHFIIMEGFVTILLGLYGLAHLLTTSKYALSD